MVKEAFLENPASVTRREILLHRPGIPREISRNQGYPRGSLRRAQKELRTKQPWHRRDRCFQAEGRPDPPHTHNSPARRGAQRKGVVPHAAARHRAPRPSRGASPASRAPPSRARWVEPARPRAEVERAAWERGRAAGSLSGRPLWARAPAARLV